MTPEQLEEIPGIGEKTLERISVAVRHYFGHFEEGEETSSGEESPSPEGTERAAAEEEGSREAAGEAVEAAEEEETADPTLEHSTEAGTEDLVAGDEHLATAGQSQEHESGSEDEAAE
jgi:N utilization substance protein A